MLQIVKRDVLQLVKRDVLHTHVDGCVLEGLYIPEFGAIPSVTTTSPTMTFIKKDVSHWVQVPVMEKSRRYIIVEWSRGIEITEDFNCVPD